MGSHGETIVEHARTCGEAGLQRSSIPIRAGRTSRRRRCSESKARFSASRAAGELGFLLGDLCPARLDREGLPLGVAVLIGQDVRLDPAGLAIKRGEIGFEALQVRLESGQLLLNTQQILFGPLAFERDELSEEAGLSAPSPTPCAASHAPRN
jgi:hypothetical protein